MGFYDQISKYYDYIFPVSNETVDFIRRIAGNPPKSILDVACGTGGYSIELEKQGYNLTAVDLDKAMIEGLREKTFGTGSRIDFLQTSMLDLREKLNNRLFDVIFCIGNSLVHLENYSEVGEFFHNIKPLLSNDGKIIIQTINFNRVISKNVRSLPTISNDIVGLSFERFYRYEKALDKVFFKIILSVDGEKIENEIPLTPLKYEETIEMLKKAGFTSVNVYGDFNNSKYEKEDSYLMVIEAK